MSRKNFSLDRKARIFLEIQPTTVVGASLKKFGFWSIRGFLCVDGEVMGLERAASETGDSVVNHGSIRGSWPMAISGYPRGHSV
jgi:hypothetical protein